MVFQNPDFSLFNLTVREEIEFGLKNFKFDIGDNKIKEILNLVGISDFIDRDPQSLSLGEKQKVSLACVLALQTDYIVLDEPIAQLDYRSSVDFYKILQRLNKKGKTIIVIEHDSDFLAKYTSEILILDKGKKYISGKSKNILSNNEMLKKIGLKTLQINHE
jgi:energy-coupling factor transporter ATP-binding protein EcfA2